MSSDEEQEGSGRRGGRMAFTDQVCLSTCLFRRAKLFSALAGTCTKLCSEIETFVPPSSQMSLRLIVCTNDMCWY